MYSFLQKVKKVNSLEIDYEPLVASDKGATKTYNNIVRYTLYMVYILHIAFAINPNYYL